MAKISFKKNNNFTVSVPSAFIETYMPKANGSFVKVYLYGLMCSLLPNIDVTNKDIAHSLDMLESDVHKAWKYWENEGIVKLNNYNDNVHIEFLDITRVKNSKTSNITQSKPNYHPKELDIYINNNSQISFLFKVAQEKLGKLLSPNDSSTLFGFYDWLRLPVEVIIMLLEYCASMDKRNMRYIEKIAIDWADRGINSVEKAEALLKEIENNKKNSIESQKQGKTTKNNKFLNFNQRNVDFNEITRLISESDSKESGVS